MAGDRAGDSQRIVVAYDLFARQRGVASRAGISVAGSARAVGVSRSRFYAYWDTAGELADDLALHRSATGWPAQVMADGGDDVFEALRRALHHPGVATGVIGRAVLAAEPVGTPGHGGLQAWEGRWLTWLASRLRDRFDDGAEVPWTVAAATITALVEGILLLRGPHLEASTAPFDASLAGLVADTAAKVAGRFHREVRGADPPLADPDGAGRRVRPAGATRLLERLEAALDAGSLSVASSDERRVIGLDAIARELDLTTRALTYHWPTPADLNADLLGESLRRLGAVTDEVALSTFIESSATDLDHVAAVLVRVNERLMDLDDLPEALVLLSLMDLLDSPIIAAQYVERIQRWCADNEMRAAAILQATGRRLVPEVTLTDYATLAIGTGLGGWRVGAAHRELLTRRCTYLGADFGALAAGLDVITQVCLQPGAQLA